MNVNEINLLLLNGKIENDELWPNLTALASHPIQFPFEFELKELPLDPGLITIRGARQYGKSTWLELHLKKTIERFGSGSAFYLNGDVLASIEDLYAKAKELHGLYSPQAPVKRLFIDEITAIPEWQKAIKRLIDEGLFRDTLIITTGSKASDLRHGSERLPGRKGKLEKSDYLFLPLSFKHFSEKASGKFGPDTWKAYLLTGGSPVACREIIEKGILPEYFIQLIKDWIFGEIVASGRNRTALTQLIQCIFEFGGTPVGFAKLAREAGLANNTVASGYVEQLGDCLSVLPSWPMEGNKKTFQFRKPCKFHFINLAVAIALDSSQIRSIAGFDALPEKRQAILLEWLVAQELWRRQVLANVENPEAIGFWTSKEHEIDFALPTREFIEVKRGRAGPMDFGWFAQSFPKDRLKVICTTPFETAQIKGMTMNEFLLGD